MGTFLWVTLYSEGPSQTLWDLEAWGMGRMGTTWASSSFGEGDGEEPGERDEVKVLLSSHSHLL